MVTLPGKLLVAAPRLADPNFYRTVVLILEHNEDGAVGLILNRATTEPAAKYLPEWETRLVPPGLVHTGGPVQPEVAVGLGRSNDPTAVAGLVFIDPSDPPDDSAPKVRIYSGYSGWSSGQLEGELAEGAWIVVDAAPDDAFAHPEGLWRQVLRRQPGLLGAMGLQPEDPRLN